MDYKLYRGLKELVLRMQEKARFKIYSVPKCILTTKFSKAQSDT